jgi:hypothetical protein
MTLPSNADEHLPAAGPQQGARLQRSLQQAVNHAVASDGWRGFQTTERTAAYHEAGRAVPYALANIRVQHAWIKGVRVKGARTWVGECQAGIPWEVGEQSSLAQDMLFARIILAGWLAEWLFVPEDLRAGSRIDEVRLAGALCATSAHKAGCSQSAMLRNAMDSAIGLLREHESAVRCVAGALIRCRKLDGAQLCRLLPAVKARDAG